MRMHRFGVAAIATALLAVAGCGSGGGSHGARTVTWMSWETIQTNNAMDAAFGAFTKSTGIALKRQEAPNADYAQKLASLIMSKKIPDFFWCSNTEEQTLAAQGLLYDWTAYAKKNQGIDLSKFSPGSLDSWYAKGKLYGIPTLANTYGVFYNKKLFDKAHVKVPAAGWTYDEMFADAAKLTGRNGAKQGLVTQWPLLTNPFGLAQYSVSAGGQPLATTATNVKQVTADPKMVEAAKRYATAIKAGQITTPDYAYNADPAIPAFANGSVPMLFGGQWVAQTMVDDKPSFEWGYVPMPRVDKNVQFTESNGVCSPATLGDPDQVWKAISYLETNVFNETMRKIPVAPIAYQPGSTGYFQALEGQGAGPKSMAATIRYEFAAPVKVQSAFLDGWATKALNILKADWNPAIAGKTDPAAGVAKTMKEINTLASGS
ncbi:sugar ABC transporter substrate-binding protein [Actinoallomurus oryzae]|uniref:Sugar ABC transporter substrate-binding protein n=1 Tax=Actinoallomurus oryzae TaxID=502180 RepID=A0ABP8PKS9_9ACTN